YEQVIASLGTELFVKPVNAGSSVGVNKVSDAEAFTKALDEAAQHDSKVLIEKSIKGREIEVAVLGNETPAVSGVGEIIPGESFYSYEDKYSPTSSARIVIPADLSQELVETLRRYARQAYVATLGRGMARIDFFVTDGGEAFIG